MIFLQEIYNEICSENAINSSQGFQKADYLYFNFKEINPPEGIRFGCALIIEFASSEFENKEIPLPSQFADSNLLLPLDLKLEIPEDIGEFKFKFKISRKIEIQILAIKFEGKLEQIESSISNLESKLDIILNKLEELEQEKPGRGNSGNNPPINSKSKKNKNNSELS